MTSERQNARQRSHWSTRHYPLRHLVTLTKYGSYTEPRTFSED